MKYVEEITKGNDDCKECCLRQNCTYDPCRLEFGKHYKEIKEV